MMEETVGYHNYSKNRSRQMSSTSLPSMPDLSELFIERGTKKRERSTSTRPSTSSYQTPGSPPFSGKRICTSSLVKAQRFGKPRVESLGHKEPYQKHSDPHVHPSTQYRRPNKDKPQEIRINDTVKPERENSLEIKAKYKAEEISFRLRNILKLPKAHKWVCYEWFYGNIDKVLFDRDNDFQSCLKEQFPDLKTTKLTRTEWSLIRRLMGKPRRCSSNFFFQEREELARKRQKVRMIQQRIRLPDECNLNDLPDEIPLLITIGTEVTARVRRPKDGIFSGRVEGVDNSNNTYRINFLRKELGTQSIVDYEVKSNTPPETMSVSSIRMKLIGHVPGMSQSMKLKIQNHDLLKNMPEGIPMSPFPVDAVFGGFPVRLLDVIVRLTRLLKAKREKNLDLKGLNGIAEKCKAKAYRKPYSKELKLNYAKCILEMGEMNKVINKYLEILQICCKETSDNRSSSLILDPSDILTKANTEASSIVSTYNFKSYSGETAAVHVHSLKIVSLIELMASLIIQVRVISHVNGERKAYELRSLEESVLKMKASLSGNNVSLFENKIEIPMMRIMAGLQKNQPNLNSFIRSRH